MKINIEEYLKNNEDGFDIEQPDEAMLWEGISSKIDNKKVHSGFNYWKIAAIFLAFFSLAYIIYNELDKQNQTEFSLSQIDRSLGERESAYQQIVFDKMKAANINEISSNAEYKIILELSQQLNQLDTIYQDAMHDLAQHGYLEQIVDIVFDTYEKRIRILEQIIRETHKIEIHENDHQPVLL